jgi:hypothetical protein
VRAGGLAPHQRDERVVVTAGAEIVRRDAERTGAADARMIGHRDGEVLDTREIDHLDADAALLQRGADAQDAEPHEGALVEQECRWRGDKANGHCRHHHGR